MMRLKRTLYLKPACVLFFFLGAGPSLGQDVSTSTSAAVEMFEDLEDVQAAVLEDSSSALDNVDSVLPEGEGAGVWMPAENPTVRALHLTAWVAGTRKSRRRFLDHLDGTVVNAIVVPIKESDGRVYIPNVAPAKKFGTERTAIPRPDDLLKDLRERGLYSIARIVVFKDNVLPTKRPEWSIMDKDGGLWRNDKGLAWVDPYRKEVWDYNLEVAIEAARLGFDEIQFDYIRFPSDGAIERCRYSRADHSGETAVAAMNDFLKYARGRLKDHNVELSVAVFGMVVSVADGLGIGQKITDMTERVDHVSPMMYPSHYRKGAYGLKSPNHNPYEVIRYGLRDAKRQLKRNSYKLIPYLQDFSLGVKYGPKEVLAQIRAAREHGIENWILWNPVNRYNWDALRFESPLTEVSAPVP